MKKVAYLVNQYPAVSHTFIRREIQALERLGVNVTRFALRADSQTLVDTRDQAELAKTIVVTQARLTKVFSHSVRLFLQSPITFIKTLWLSITLGKRAQATIRHLAYFFEACFITRELILKNVGHLHAHFGTNSTTIALMCNSLCGIDYSFTVHGPEEFDKPITLSLDKKIQHAKFVAAISSYGRSQLCRWTSYSNWSKINIIRCGLDFSEYPTKVESKQAKLPRLICVGRLCEQKAQLLLIDTVAELIHSGTALELVLVGDGPMKSEIEQAIVSRGCADNIEITGWLNQDQIKQEILQSRALVLPSFAEGLPVVIMETLALGKPVISTYIAGIPELIVNDRNGWLVPAGDVVALNEAIKKVLSYDNSRLSKIAIACSESVKRQHDIDSEAYKLNKLIQVSGNIF